MTMFWPRRSSAPCWLCSTTTSGKTLLRSPARTSTWKAPGHSCVIHSNTKEHIEYVPTRVNVSRYGVNQVGGTGLGGAMDNGLNPTTTLGCGTWGGNSISENIYYHNLMNVSRISYKIKNKKFPTDEEIWAD